MLQGDNQMSVKVQLPRWIPNSYCPEIDSEWMPYTQWRESYKLAFAFEPPFYANLEGEVWYAYFLSPVDSKLPKNMIRILSAEISQDYESIFINQINYHFTETREAMREGWRDVEEELFYLQDSQYLQAKNTDETMVFCGEFKGYKELIRFIGEEYDGIN